MLIPFCHFQRFVSLCFLLWNQMHVFENINSRKSNLGVYTSIENMTFSTTIYLDSETTVIIVIKENCLCKHWYWYKIHKIGYTFSQCPIKLQWWFQILNSIWLESKLEINNIRNAPKITTAICGQKQVFWYYICTFFRKIR